MNLFRGKHIHAISQNQHMDGTWIEGYLSDKNYINSPEFEGDLLVDESTICRCTGVLDKKRRKIFEGDIIKRKVFENFIIGQVVWFDIGCCGFYLKCNKNYYPIGREENSGIAKDDEIIGNIFDNPELINFEIKGEAG